MPEVFVGDGGRSFALGGEGGGETIGIVKFVVGAEFGGEAGGDRSKDAALETPQVGGFEMEETQDATLPTGSG